jgi:hypothetical protein
MLHFRRYDPELTASTQVDTLEDGEQDANGVRAGADSRRCSGDGGVWCTGSNSCTGAGIRQEETTTGSRPGLLRSVSFPFVANSHPLILSPPSQLHRANSRLPHTLQQAEPVHRCVLVEAPREEIQQLTTSSFAAALALRSQLVLEGEEIPTEEWDKVPDVLVTPDGEI